MLVSMTGFGSSNFEDSNLSINVELKSFNSRYFELNTKSFELSGPLEYKIRNYLIGKGVGDKYIKNTIDQIHENNEDQDFFSAIKICKKKRIGPSRQEDNRPLFYKKDMGVLARSGFDFEVSRRVMDLDKDEYIKIINLL